MRAAVVDLVDELSVVEEVASTNDWALSAAANSATWRLFVAERQTAGRGRRGNQWWSAEGVLTFSLRIVMDQTGLPADRWQMMPLVTGAAVRRALAEAVPATVAATVKWPNDVYLGDRKVAGILVEQLPNAYNSLIVGIGINVNNDFSNAPDPLKTTAVSARQISGEPLDETQILATVIRALRAAIIELTTSPAAFVADLNKASYLADRDVRVSQGDEVIVGRFRHIADSGAILLDTPNGPRTCIAGTIERLF